MRQLRPARSAVARLDRLAGGDVDHRRQQPSGEVGEAVRRRAGMGRPGPGAARAAAAWPPGRNRQERQCGAVRGRGRRMSDVSLGSLSGYGLQPCKVATLMRRQHARSRRCPRARRRFWSCRPCRVATAAMPRSTRLRIPRPAADRRHRRTGCGVPAAGRRGVRHRRYRVHARAHLLAGTVRGAAGRRCRSRRGGRPGRGPGPGAARPPDGGAGAEGVPRRAAGHRDLRAEVRRRAAAAVRHADRRHGGRVRRPGRLRLAGGQPDRRHRSTRRTGSATGRPARCRRRRSPMPRRTSPICARSIASCALGWTGRAGWTGWRRRWRC